MKNTVQYNEYKPMNRPRCVHCNANDDNFLGIFTGHPETPVYPHTTAWRVAPEWSHARQPSSSLLLRWRPWARSLPRLQGWASTRKPSGTTRHRPAATCWESLKIVETTRWIGGIKKNVALHNPRNYILRLWDRATEVYKQFYVIF